MTDAVRVLLADDHPGVRSAVRADLEDAGVVVCAEASTASDAVEAALRERPDVCLLDVRMPGSGLVAAWDISSRLAETKVVMLTTSRSEEHELAALRSGAVGYVLKDVDGARLAEALQGFVRGEVGISARAASRLLEIGGSEGHHTGRLGRRRSPRTPPAPDHGAQVLALVSGGCSLPDAAAELGMSASDAGAELTAALERVRLERDALALLDV